MFSSLQLSQWIAVSSSQRGCSNTTASDGSRYHGQLSVRGETLELLAPAQSEGPRVTPRAEPFLTIPVS
jgi:hypothetical protein